MLMHSVASLACIDLDPSKSDSIVLNRHIQRMRDGTHVLTLAFNETVTTVIPFSFASDGFKWTEPDILDPSTRRSFVLSIVRKRLSDSPELVLVPVPIVNFILVAQVDGVW
jgi:hypothetical protein